jgi:hypothetical protein
MVEMAFVARGGYTGLTADARRAARAGERCGFIVIEDSSAASASRYVTWSVGPLSVKFRFSGHDLPGYYDPPDVDVRDGLERAHLERAFQILGLPVHPALGGRCSRTESAAWQAAADAALLLIGYDWHAERAQIDAEYEASARATEARLGITRAQAAAAWAESKSADEARAAEFCAAHGLPAGSIKRVGAYDASFVDVECDGKYCNSIHPHYVSMSVRCVVAAAAKRAAKRR